MPEPQTTTNGVAAHAEPWWKDFSPEYDEAVHKWRYARTVYESDPDVLRKKGQYLVRKVQGEHETNYAERCRLANVVPLVGIVVDAYTGRISEAEKKIERRWNRKRAEGEVVVTERGLGDEKDPETLAGRLWHNADGRGLNYLPLLSSVATELSITKTVYGLVEGVRRDAAGNAISDPTIRLLPPEAVPITLEDGHGNLIAAVVEHSANLRSSVFDKNDVRRRLTVYTLDGFMTFEIRRNKAGVEEAVRIDGTDEADAVPYGDGFFYYDTPDRNHSDRILPIFRIEMPSRRYPAYTLAHQQVVYFNHTSELQNKHRTTNILKLQLVADDEDMRTAQLAALTAGSAVIWVDSDSNRDNRFIEPDATSLSETRDWLGAMRGEFLLSALREYEDSVRGSQKTATESAQDAAQGEHSYLNVLAGALDEFEMQAFKRIEQIEWPSEPARWGQFFVSRKKDFKPLDELGEAERLHRRYFGAEPVPVGPTAKTNTAKRIADLDEVEYDEAELAEEVRRSAERAAQERSLLEDVGIA